MPSKHFCPASNTPDPELPVVATSRIDMRARRAFRNRDDDRFARPRVVVTQRHAAHPQIDRELLLVHGQERQIHSLDIAFPNGGRGQLHASDVDARFGVGG